jgi:uncharacterized membrane protein
MSNLIVVGFKNDRFKATEVLNKLRAMDSDNTLSLDDAVSVYRGFDGELRVDQSYDLTTEEGAGWGALWGSLIGAVLAAPFTAGASTAVAAGAIAAGVFGGGALGATTGAINANWWKEDFGISEDFVNDIGSTVKPGDSAVFALLLANPEQVVKQFEGYGGKVIMTTLSKEQTDKIEQVLNRSRK